MYRFSPLVLLLVGLLPLLASDPAAAKTPDLPPESTATPPLQETRESVRAVELVFEDRFELRFNAPALSGDLYFSLDSFNTPDPAGSQLKSLSQFALNTPYRFLQADTSYMGQIDPDPTLYLPQVDFRRMWYSPGGNVTASVTAVDLNLDNPSSTTSACQASDFDGFPQGHIALIQRGVCSMAGKALRASNAGASGVIVMNQGTPGDTGLYLWTVGSDYDRTEPVVAVSFDQGEGWAEQIANGGLVLEMNIDDGRRSNSWSIKPIASQNANEDLFWITNVTTGEVLFAGAPRQVSGVEVTGLELGSVPPEDPNGWWQREVLDAGAGEVRFINQATGEYLATIVRGSDVDVIAASESAIVNTLCTTDVTCDRWQLDNLIKPPPSGAARLRNALGGIYLQGDLSSLDAGGIKSGWDDALWIFEAVPNTDYRRLKSVVSGEFLHVENGPLTMGEVQPGWLSAMWVIEPATVLSQINRPETEGAVPLDTPLTGATGYFNIRNRWTNQLLVRRNSGVEAANASADALEALWVIEDRNVPIADANLRSAINNVLGKSATAEVRSAEASGIYTLWAGDSNVGSLSGINHLFNLRDLRIAGNPFTDISPLVALVNLEYLNLERSRITNIDALLKNNGLGVGDRVLLSRSQLGLDDRETGRIFRGQNITAVPSPGHLALHKLNTRDAVESDDFDIVSLDVADQTANWGIEYSPDDSAHFIYAYPDGRKQYLYVDDQDFDLLWSDLPRSSDGLFYLTLAGTNLFKVEGAAVTGENRFLQDCYSRLDIGNNDANCEDFVVYINEQYWLDSFDEAYANYYDPQFPQLTEGYTRIQHSKSREFLSLDGSGVAIAPVAAGYLPAHWELVPIEMARKYLFAIRSRDDSTRYLYRTAGGALGQTALPGSAPDGASWVEKSDNLPFVFDLDGNALDTYILRPYGARTSALEARNGNLDFVGELSSRTFWRLDGGVAAPDITNDIILQEPTDGIGTAWPVSFAISWKQPLSDDPSQLTEVKRTGAGVYSIPANARDVKVLITCATLCGFLWEDSWEEGEVVEFYEWDRPKDICLEARGGNQNPTVSECDSAEGLLAQEAERIVEENSCAVRVAFEWYASAYSVAGTSRAAEFLASEDFERTKTALFEQGDLRAPADFLECEIPFLSASFGIGGQAGLFSTEQTGEVGVAWNISPSLSDLDAVSYSALAQEANPQARLLTLEYQNIYGWWTGTTDEMRGRAVGLTLNNNQMKTMPTRVAFALSKLTKVLGISANLTIWLTCNTGSGDVIFDEYSCTIRKDSNFAGITLDTSVGADFSVPKVKGIGVSYSETCVPAGNNDLGDCPRPQ